MAPAIKNLVTRSIEGLTAEKVSLTFFATRVKPMAAPLAPPQTSAENAVLAIAIALAVALALALIAMGVLYRRNLARIHPTKDSVRPVNGSEIRPFKRA